MFLSRATNLSHRRVIVTKYRQEGARLKKARTALGLTQAEMAQRIGSSLAAVKGYERGVSAPNRDFSRRLAALGINMEYVFTGVGDVLIPAEARQAHADMLGRVMPVAGETAPPAYAPVGQLDRLKAVAVAVTTICNRLEFTPPMHWAALVQELMLTEGLTERGAKRILETIKEDDATRRD